MGYNYTPTNIPANSDLNNYLEYGEYRILTANIPSIENCPSSTSATHNLKVMKGPAEGTYLQVLSNYAHQTYIRYRDSGGVWRDWRRFSLDLEPIFNESITIKGASPDLRFQITPQDTNYNSSWIDHRATLDENGNFISTDFRIVVRSFETGTKNVKTAANIYHFMPTPGDLTSDKEYTILATPKQTGTVGQILQSNGTEPPSWVTLSLKNHPDYNAFLSYKYYIAHTETEIKDIFFENIQDTTFKSPSSRKIVIYVERATEGTENYEVQQNDPPQVQVGNRHFFELFKSSSNTGAIVVQSYGGVHYKYRSWTTSDSVITISDWKTLYDQNLPLTAQKITITDNSSDPIAHIKFSRKTYNYFQMPAPSSTTDHGFCFVVGNTLGTAPSSLIIKRAELIPGTTNAISLGTESNKWSGVYATNLYGNLSASYISSGKLSAERLPTASTTLGGVKTTSEVTDTTGLTACPIIEGIVYYKDTNTHAVASVNGQTGAVKLSYSDVKAAASDHTHSDYVPKSRTINGKTLSSNISLTYSDVGAAAASHGTHVTAATVKAALGTGAGTSKFLREDGTWQTVSAGTTANNATITIAAGSGLTTGGSFTTNQGSAATITLNHSNSITAGTASGSSNKTLTFGGTFTIPTISYDAQGHITGKGTTTLTMPANPNTNTTYTLSGKASGNTWITTLTSSGGSTTTSTVPAMGAATSSAAGTAGLVPAPGTGKQTSFLRGDGTWVVPTNTNTKVNVILGTTTKAYLLGTSTTPTSTATGVTAIADTGVYLDTTAGGLTASNFVIHGTQADYQMPKFVISKTTPTPEEGVLWLELSE